MTNNDGRKVRTEVITSIFNFLFTLTRTFCFWGWWQMVRKRDWGRGISQLSLQTLLSLMDFLRWRESLLFFSTSGVMLCLPAKFSLSSPVFCFSPSPLPPLPKVVSIFPCVMVVEKLSHRVALSTPSGSSWGVDRDTASFSLVGVDAVSRLFVTKRPEMFPSRGLSSLLPVGLPLSLDVVVINSNKCDQK